MFTRVEPCDIVIDNRKHIGLHLVLAQSSPNSWNFLSDQSLKGVSCHINEVTFGKPLGHLRRGLVARRTNFVVRGFQLSVLPPDVQGGERGWRLNQLSMANDLINHVYVMKPP